MSIDTHIRRLAFPLVFLFVFIDNAVSKEKIIENRARTDSTGIPKKGNIHSLTFGSVIGSNLAYMGSELSDNKPFYSGSLTYGFKSELFVSASATHLSAFDPAISFSAFSGTYCHDFNSWFDIMIGASRYQVYSSLSDTLFSNFNYGFISLGFDWKVLYTNLSASGILAGSSAIYYNLRNSRYIKISLGSKGKNSLYLEPYANLLFGKLTKSVTSEGTKIGVSSPIKAKGSSGRGSSGTSISISTFYSLIEADFGLPLGMNIGRLSIEAEPGYILPAYTYSDSYTPSGFTFMINMFIRILK